MFLTSYLNLEQTLKSMTDLHKLAFMASTIERLLPIYIFFSEQVKWGNPDCLRNALDTIWEIVGGKQIDASKISQLLECTEAAIHDGDRFGGGCCFEAQEAAISIIGTLEILLKIKNSQKSKLFISQELTRVVQHVENILFSFIDYLEYSKNPNSWTKKSLDDRASEIKSHFLMIREITKQSEDLQRLTTIKFIDLHFIDSLRGSNDGKCAIDIYLFN